MSSDSPAHWFRCAFLLVLLISSARGDEKPGAPPPAKLLTIDPITVPLTDKSVEELVWKTFEKEKPGSVQLTLKGVTVPENWHPTTSIYVFVNKPDAKADTSAKDLHFVHSFGLSYLNRQQPKNYLMEVTPALVRLKNDGKWKPGQPIEFTFVLVPDEDVTLPKSLKLKYADVVVAVPKSP